MANFYVYPGRFLTPIKNIDSAVSGTSYQVMDVWHGTMAFVGIPGRFKLDGKYWVPTEQYNSLVERGTLSRYIENMNAIDDRTWLQKLIGKRDNNK